MTTEKVPPLDIGRRLYDMGWKLTVAKSPSSDEKVSGKFDYDQPFNPSNNSTENFRGRYGLPWFTGEIPSPLSKVDQRLVMRVINHPSNPLCIHPLHLPVVALMSQEVNDIEYLSRTGGESAYESFFLPLHESMFGVEKIKNPVKSIVELSPPSERADELWNMIKPIVYWGCVNFARKVDLDSINEVEPHAKAFIRDMVISFRQHFGWMKLK